MAEPGIQLGVVGGVCPRCSQPEDLLPIQQAVVVRSFSRRFAASFGAPAPSGLPVAAHAPSGGVAGQDWDPLEHLTYVSAMLAAAYIHLSELLGHECLDGAPPVVGTYRACGNPEVEAALARLDDQAERLGQTIMRGAAIRDWQAAVSRDGTSPHELVHRAIDEATEHLRGLEGPTPAEAHLSFVGSGPPPRSMVSWHGRPSLRLEASSPQTASRRRYSAWRVKGP